MRILLTVLLFSGLFSAPLSAAVVTNLDKPLSIVASVGNISGVNHRAANGFILNETSILQSATLRMFSTQGITTANFTLDLYSATATKPDSLLASFSGETNPDASDFVYTIDNYLIEAGTEYFLVASALNQSEGDYFVWSGTNTLTETGDGIISDVIYGSSDNGSWFGGVSSTLFSLDFTPQAAVVPEPGSLLLLISGLFTIAGIRIRQQAGV